MSLQMGFTKKLELRTEKVKSVDMHPSEPLVASAMYNGSLTIYNYNTQALVKKIEMSDSPLRCCKFVARKQWIVAAGDKMCIWVYNYNSLEKVNVVEGHKDYVRYLDLHPSLPYVLSCSDDMTVVLWDFDRNWEKLAVFEGHSHYVMMCKWSPKDANIFASCSLDKTISFWRVSPEADRAGPNKPYFTLTGHERGVNCIDFTPNLSVPYIISGSDDCSIRVWDYQTKLCLQVLKKHFKPVSCVMYHPRLPVILSTGEDGDFNVWHSSLYKIKRSVNYGYGQLWQVASTRTDTALATDSGTFVLELAGAKPLVAMFSNKLLMVKSSDIMTCNLTSLSDLSTLDSSQPLNLSFRSIGSSEFFPQDVSYHPNGRFICLCGDSEYIIYTSQGMKSKTFGKSSQVVWSFEGDYATYDGFEVSVFSEFTLKEKLDLPQVQKLHGGRFLGVSTDTTVSFYTWSPCALVKTFTLAVDEIYWHPQASKLALSSQAATYVLVCNFDENRPSARARLVPNSGEPEDPFKLEKELLERVTSGLWVGETFAFVTADSHLSLYLGGHVETLAYLDRPLHLVGYLQETQLFYLCDDSVYGYHLQYNYLLFHAKLLAYHRLRGLLAAESEGALTEAGGANLEALREDLKGSLSSLDEKMSERACKFLQLFSEYELGLLCTKNEDLQFELYLKLGNVNECFKLLQYITNNSFNNNNNNKFNYNNNNNNNNELNNNNNNNNELDNNNILNLDEIIKRKWKRLGDYCLKISNINIAKYSYKYSNNLQNLLILYTLTGNLYIYIYILILILLIYINFNLLGDKEGIEYVANTSLKCKLYNISFTSYYMLNQIEQCVQILHNVNKHAEATFMARTYKPNLINNSFNIWNNNLKNKNVKLMKPNFNYQMDTQQQINSFPDSSQYLKYKDSFFSDFNKQT